MELMESVNASAERARRRKEETILFDMVNNRNIEQKPEICANIVEINMTKTAHKRKRDMSKTAKRDYSGCIMAALLIVPGLLMVIMAAVLWRL